MSETLILRNELHKFIDIMPERSLSVLKPLLTVLADEPMVIETDLTDEEHKIIEESVNRYHANPGSFVSLDKLVNS